ncbi:MAG: phenylalanine--tRNA ligase subunit alpha [Nitrospinae bacterium]|nr:phenylalanine--tRNA ligase subunit alpha [Nitrospinota bacterium]
MALQFTIGKFQELYNTISKEIEAISHSNDVDYIKSKYLGRKGSLNNLFSEMAKIPPNEKKTFGQELNTLKNSLNTELENKVKTLKTSEAPILFDFSRPSLINTPGSRHLLSKTIAEISRIFETLGFNICEGPEIETTYYNFDGLNIPETHAARDFKDNFYLDDKLLLRSQTSTVQLRVMEQSEPPYRFVSPGRVYRPDAVDASHYFMFHQIEGVAVDKDVTFGDMKYVLRQFSEGFFGKDVKTRMRPHFFPFTEPSAEIDISCIICNGKGCPLCKHNGWLEVLGCGMIDPNVFSKVQVNTEKYSGFAFGLGVERIAMLKHGISDIRLFFENDARFLQQF